MNALINPIDDQLNAVFAEHVAGWRRTVEPWNNGLVIVPEERWRAKGMLAGTRAYWSKLPVDYTKSTDAATQHLGSYALTLERIPEWTIQWQVQVSDDDHTWVGRADSPAKALVIALPHVHGIPIPSGP